MIDSTQPLLFSYHISDTRCQLDDTSDRGCRKLETPLRTGTSRREHPVAEETGQPGLPHDLGRVDVDEPVVALLGAHSLGVAEAPSPSAGWSCRRRRGRCPGSHRWRVAGTFTMITRSGTTSGVIEMSPSLVSPSRACTFSWIL